MLVKKLVIAEDDDSIAHLVAASLGDAGFLCLRAWDGEEAVNLVRTELPDALVLDLMLPKLDGIGVCKRLKGDVLLSRVPILMLTSLADVENRIAGLEAGADDYMCKPFNMRELAARVKALIRQNRRERDRNPTTLLPGVETIEDQVSELILKGEGFALLYLDIENFRSYADTYGYRQAEEVVAATGHMLLEEARSASDRAPLIGHVGGDDFIIICENADIADRLRARIVGTFAQQVTTYYSEDHHHLGFVPASDGHGGFREAKLMSLSVASIECPPGAFESIEDLALEVARVKLETRQNTGSGTFSLRP